MKRLKVIPAVVLFFLFCVSTGHSAPKIMARSSGVYFSAALLKPQRFVVAPGYTPSVPNPVYASGAGSTVMIDAGHNNYHTAAGRFKPFADLLTADGYVVADMDAVFSEATLAGIDILVIVNPQHISNVNLDDTLNNWKLPTPSAYTADEVAALKTWVQAGGSLLLIADHFPFPGCAADISKSFGFISANGYNYPQQTSPAPPRYIQFDLVGNSSSIIDGRTQFDESVSSVTSFIGHSFWATGQYDAHSLMVLPDLSNTFVVDSTNTLESVVTPEDIAVIPYIDSYNQLQGATINIGSGRVGMFGEAGMFTAQITELSCSENLCSSAPCVDGKCEFKMGMNNKDLAPDNEQFVLNVVHWLDSVSGMDTSSIFNYIPAFIRQQEAAN